VYQSNVILCFWRKVSVFLIEAALPARLQVSHLLFFDLFPRKKRHIWVPAAWCWRCQSKDLIVGEENGVFSAYFLLDSGEDGDASCLVQLLM